MEFRRHVTVVSRVLHKLDEEGNRGLIAQALSYLARVRRHNLYP